MPNITISRHCMQRLLHDAQSLELENCRGLLAGRGNMLENVIPVTLFFHGNGADQPQSGVAESASGTLPSTIYLCTNANGKIDSDACTELVSCYQACGGIGEPRLLVIEIGHAGRLDALLYADIACSRSLALEMTEDANLYPQRLNG